MGVPTRPRPSASGPAPDLASIRAGGKTVVARALSALETDPEADGVVALLDAAHATPRGVVIGLTGPPGVGKSTLTSALLAGLRARGRTVAVVAVDPSSRRSRGALLGDRTRIASDPDDAGAFVRSMAARDRLGGLADLTFPAVVLLRALYDRVIVETVGVGQSESDVRDVADLVLLCAQPGAGDALQFMKAGIVELPDMVLVTKADLGAAATRTAADLRGALSLAEGGEPPVPVALVSSTTGAGLADAICAVEALAAALECDSSLATRRGEQTAAWVAARLADSFGREGVALLDSIESPPATPFAALAARRNAVRGALEQLRQTP